MPISWENPAGQQAKGWTGQQEGLFAGGYSTHRETAADARPREKKVVLYHRDVEQIVEGQLDQLWSLGEGRVGWRAGM